MEQQTINLKHYVAVATRLVFQSCKVIRQLGNCPDLKKYQKFKDDPVTEADFKIQTLIIKGIRHFFPTLNIVGQESTEFIGKIDLDLSSFVIEDCPIADLQEKVPVSELCVWIDPIDNTKGFIKGNFDEVTVLIGLSRHNLSEIGLVGLPYCKSENTLTYSPEVIFGSKSHRRAFSRKENSKWIQLQRPMIGKPIRTVSSGTRAKHKIQDAFCQAISATAFQIGGAGKKYAMVIKGEADMVMYFKSANCKWDTCAVQAIIRAMGGHVCDCSGNEIIYDRKDKSNGYVNANGNIGLFDRNLYDCFLEFSSKSKKEAC